MQNSTITDSGIGFIYQRLADELATMIRTGSYRAGDRLPSLRQFCRKYDVSMSTALQVYRSLETALLVESRPKSGYFVSPQQGGETYEPAISRPSMAPEAVTSAQMAVDILEEARRPELINLGAAIPGPDNLPLKSFSRITSGLIRRKPELLGRYERPAGNDQLRQRLVRRWREAGCACAGEEVIITNGCQEALVLSLRAVAKAGDVIAIESPTYYGVLQTIESLGMRALEIPTHPRDGVDLDALQRVVLQGLVVACLFIPSFNNPLGSCMPVENRRRLAEMLAQAKVPLIEDDIYGDLGYREPRLPTVKSFDNSGNVLLCSSFSKTLVPGFRIGYVLAGNWSERLRHLKLLGNVATAGLPQVALAEYLQRGGYHRLVRQAAQTYRWRSEQIRALVLHYFPPGTLVTRPQGGFVLWVEMPPEVDCVRLHDLALRAGISVTPGVIFSPSGDYRHHIRISCGQLAAEQAEPAIRRLGQIAGQLLDDEL
ncbi:MAG: PLP-dependent aminotransferase family protein [Candidatus Thiodiazotropha sp.]